MNDVPKQAVHKPKEEMVFSSSNSSSRTLSKIFVVSNNKCGTTSLQSWAKRAGLDVGEQKKGEIWVRRAWAANSSRTSFKQLFRYIEGGNFFQDAPFSHRSMLPWLLFHFPQAKYLYVVRDADGWYRSLVSAHCKIVGEVPSFDENGSLRWNMVLEEAFSKHPYLGYPLHLTASLRYGSPRQDPYQREILTAYHRSHTEQAHLLLKTRHSLFLQLEELSRVSTAMTLAQFVGLDTAFPITRDNQSR